MSDEFDTEYDERAEDAEHGPELAPAAELEPAPATVPADEPVPAPAVPTVAEGSTVVLVVSTGRDTQESPMDLAAAPDVLFRDQADALRIIDDVGMCARVFFDLPYGKGVTSGSVQAQVPDAGLTTRYSTPQILMLASGSVKDATAAVELPDVVGLSEEDAVARVRAAGLIPEVVRQDVAHKPVPAGIVALQLPDAAALARAAERKRRRWGLYALIAAVVVLIAAVAFGYSWWTTPIAVPDVVGLEQSEAKTRLEQAGFETGKVEFEPSRDKPAGEVLDQDPGEGTKLQRGSAIDLTLSGGAELVAVPDLKGKTRDEAASALTKASLEATVAESYDASAAIGAVLSQVPLAGERVEPGITVRVIVSKGPAPRTAAVPIIDGKTYDVARSAVASVGFSVSAVWVHDSVGTGLVITSLPGPGSGGFIGDPVVLVLSAGARPSDATTVPASVPGVTGETVDVARGRIVSAKLSPIAIEVYSDTVAVGRVIAQYPSPGVTRRAGDVVVLTVSRGRKP